MAHENENNIAKEPGVKVVPILEANEHTKLENVSEFHILKGVHEKFLEKVGKQELKELTGQTTIGNIFCVSSGYVGNKLGTKPDFARVLKTYEFLFNGKKSDVSAGVSACLKAFETARKNGKPIPTLDACVSFFGCSEEDYNTALKM